MDPCIECPYCGLDLLGDLGQNHDLLDCKMTASSRARIQVEELEEIWDLKGSEGKE